MTPPSETIRSRTCGGNLHTLPRTGASPNLQITLVSQPPPQTILSGANPSAVRRFRQEAIPKSSDEIEEIVSCGLRVPVQIEEIDAPDGSGRIASRMHGR